MEKETKLTLRDSLLIQMLLLDPVIHGQLVNKSDKEVYAQIVVDRTTGDLIFGRTKFSWLNHFIGDEKKISFLDFAMKTVAALSGQQNNYNERILGALSQEVIKKAVMEDDYGFIVNRLFDACRYGNKSSTRSTAQPPLVTDNVKRIVRVEHKDYRVDLNSGEAVGIFKYISRE